MRQIVSDIFCLPVIGLKIIEGAALDAAIEAAWTYSQTDEGPPLEKIVNFTVKTDRKTRAEPRKENATIYVKLGERHPDLTAKLASSGYL
jgi:sugar (pentulose or hexulose) kinase